MEAVTLQLMDEVFGFFETIANEDAFAVVVDLQVLNDIRVGSWIQLGEPDPMSEMSQPLNEQTMILAWTMEIAGLFQNSLLEAAHSAD